MRVKSAEFKNTKIYEGVKKREKLHNKVERSVGTEKKWTQKGRAQKI